MANEQNLKPFTGADDPRRMNGRPKGLKSWSTIVKQLLEDEQFADKVIDKRPGWWDSLPNKNMANIIATAMMIKAVNGDHKASEWVRKTGFGDKLDITSDDKPIPILGLNVQPDTSTEEDTEASQAD